MHSLAIEHTFPAKRLISSMAMAGVVTFSLFALMQQLIKQDNPPPPAPDPSVFIDPVNTPRDTPVAPRPALKAPPPAIKAPATPQMITPSSTEGPTIAVHIPAPGINPPAIEPGIGVGEREATPLVRYQPDYPADAVRNHIEGWVKLSFDISPDGRVTNIQVMDAEPKRVFDRSARKALARWKYQPKKADGIFVSQPNQQIVISFSLDDVAH